MNRIYSYVCSVFLGCFALGLTSPAGAFDVAKTFELQNRSCVLSLEQVYPPKSKGFQNEFLVRLRDFKVLEFDESRRHVGTHFYSQIEGLGLAAKRGDELQSTYNFMVSSGESSSPLVSRDANLAVQKFSAHLMTPVTRQSLPEAGRFWLLLSKVSSVGKNTTYAVSITHEDGRTVQPFHRGRLRCTR